VLLPLFGLFGYAALRSGPLAPIPITQTTVETRAIAPALFGIGTVEARYRYPIGPVVAGRVLRMGDRVRAGQRLGEMDPVDLDERVAAQEAARQRAESAIQAAEAQVRDGFTVSQRQHGRIFQPLFYVML
jgi:multidrug efflux pump subunit AcrA (membrane-fusion protein)